MRAKRVVNDNQIAQLFLEQALRERQRRRQEATASFSEWLPQASPEYNWTWPHLAYVQKYIDKITRGEIKRLMVFMPPQHGKSSQLTIRYPAYLLEKDPKKRIVIAAYGTDLAEEFSGQIRSLVRARGIVSLDGEKQAIDRWRTNADGGLKAVGIGSAVTGFSADLIIIDDPVKNREEANSKATRERNWKWYTDDLMTRQQANTPIILQMCMTGDTPVLMSNGTELHLKDISPGMEIATYDNGELTTSQIRNHRSNGLDYIFKMKTTCGKIVRANGRHPFLVEEEGQLKWIRLKNLTTAHKIVTVKTNGANGEGKLASSKAARNLSAQEVTVSLTTERKCGLTDTDHPQLILNHNEMPVLNTVMELLPSSMIGYSRLRTENVLFVNNHPETMFGRTGQENFALTIATELIEFEPYYATTVISPLATQRTEQTLLPLQNTSAFTTTGIESITPDGIEEVFDLQVDRTENFIANGLVSHNTRWHEDDLAGRLLERNPIGTDLEWTVIRLPALCEGNDPEDYPVKREFDEPLCPDLHPYSQLMDFKETMQSSFAALYQQRPTPSEGEVWKKAWFNEEGKDDTPLRVVPKFPNGAKLTQVWDTALETKESNDFSAMVEGCMDDLGNIYIAAMVNERLDFPSLARRMRQEYDRIDGGDLCVEDKASGKPARQQLKREGIPVIEIPAGTKDKEARAKSVTQYAEGGKIYFVMQPGNCNDILLQQLVTFPNGRWDDLHDAFVHILRRLSSRAQRWSKNDIRKLMVDLVDEESVEDLERLEMQETQDVFLPNLSL
jgi:predicted phage terminase large subunit-like protein